MDPISRRGVWNIIEKAKKNKVIVLTTHSMEEADVLGDKIAIMARGRLQCVGTSLHVTSKKNIYHSIFKKEKKLNHYSFFKKLKQKFGAGYRITFGTKEELVPEVEKFVKENLQGAELTSVPISGYMNFAVPRETTKDLVPFFRKLEEENNRLGIHDVQLSLTTLEVCEEKLLFFSKSFFLFLRKKFLFKKIGSFLNYC